jgi:hypothetical protein
MVYTALGGFHAMEKVGEYIKALGKFKRELEEDGCPGCGAEVETNRSKFHYLDWNQFRCSESKCKYGKHWNDIFLTFARLRLSESGQADEVNGDIHRQGE